MFEDDLRAAFARHEELAPPAGPVRAAIDRLARRRRRRRLLLRGTGAALAVLVAVSAPVIVKNGTEASELLGGSPTPTSAVPDQPLNFLLLGLDYRTDRDMGARADTIMIVHVPRDRSATYLISIPRDLVAEIPGHGQEKINAAFHFGSVRAGAKPDLAGGAQLTQRVLADVTGLQFDGSVTLTYTALRKLTDAVGGVRMCLDQPVKSVHTGHRFPSGCQRLDGRSATDLLRQRSGLRDGAHDRDRNGQRFVRALVGQAATGSSLTDPAKVGVLLRTVGDGLSLDTAGLPLADLLAVAARMRGAEIVGVGWSFASTEGDSHGRTRLDAELGASLFDALRRDALREWVRAHPKQLTP